MRGQALSACGVKSAPSMMGCIGNWDDQADSERHPVCDEPWPFEWLRGFHTHWAGLMGPVLDAPQYIRWPIASGVRRPDDPRSSRRSCTVRRMTTVAPEHAGAGASACNEFGQGARARERISPGIGGQTLRLECGEDRGETIGALHDHRAILKRAVFPQCFPRELPWFMWVSCSPSFLGRNRKPKP